MKKNGVDVTETIESIFRDENSLLDTKLDEIEICSGGFKQNLQISLVFSGFRKKSDFSKISLLFQGVKEFSFYHSDEYIFYNVESFKLLKIESDIYLCLDPADDSQSRSENDLDYILAKQAILFDM